MSLRRLLSSHLAPYRSILWLVLLFQAIQTFASLTLPTLSAEIINKGVLAGDNGEIRRIGAIMLAFTVLQIIFTVFAVRYGARAAMGFGRDVRRDLFHRVTDFSTREVGHFGAPSLITRITNDVQQVQLLTVMGITMMVTAPLTLTIGVLMALREDVGLSIVILFILPLAVILLGSIIRRMVPAFAVMQERIDRVNLVLREQITGIRVVRAFVREPEQAARFADANQGVTDVSLQAGRLMSAVFPAVMVIMNGSSIAVLWVGAGRIDSGATNIGALVAFLSYIVQILMAIVMGTFMLSMIPRAGVAAERIQEVLNTEPSVHPPTDPVMAFTEPGTLEFRQVGFRYPGAELPVLTDVSFRIEPGETLAIIGSTGSGKTTMVNLVPRLFDATEGTALVGGVDVRDLDPDLLWSNVGYVPQKAYLFNGTIASNLRFGNPDATDHELWQALEIAQAAGFVRAMTNGLESTITSGGTNVSGGQRQRLAIARALVVKPDIFVFDDSFSALDLSTDAALRGALRPHTRDAAVMIVAQRVSSIVDADHILVLENGVVVGYGRHDDLLATCPTYIEIVESQLGEGAVAT